MLLSALAFLLAANLAMGVALVVKIERLRQYVDALGWDVSAVKRAFQAETVAKRLSILRTAADLSASHLRVVKPGKTPQK